MSKQINKNLFLRESSPAALMVGASIGKFYGYNFVVSSNLSDVQNGLATHNTVASAISAAVDGQSILILSGTYTETITHNKRLTIRGFGYDSFINGVYTLTTASDFSNISAIRVSQFILDSGSDGNIVSGFWSVDPTDSGTGNNITGVNIT